MDRQTDREKTYTTPPHRKPPSVLDWRKKEREREISNCMPARLHLPLIERKCTAMRRRLH